MLLKIIFCFFLFFQSIYSLIEQYQNSTYGTTRYNLELVAINEGKEMYKKWMERKEPRKPLLCGVFTTSSGKHTPTLLRNMQLTENICDWAVILYDGDESELCQGKIKERSVLCKRNADSLKKRTKKIGDYSFTLSLPKTAMYSDFLPVVENYERVLLFDEDISADGFNVKNFFKAWDCITEYPPMVSQPLIFESTQYFRWVNANFWEKKFLKDIYLNEILYIEQQIPAFDAKFFQWFTASVISRVKTDIINNGADWGQDRTWCPAGRAYAQLVLGFPESYSPCNMYPHSGSVHHLNGKTINAKQKNIRFFQMGAMNSVQSYINTFPTWVITDTFTSNPFSPVGKHIYKRYDLNSFDKECPADIFDTK